MADDSVDIDLYAGVEDFSGDEKIDCDQLETADDESNTNLEDSYLRQQLDEPVKPPIILNTSSDTESHNLSDKNMDVSYEHKKISRLADFCDDTSFESPPIQKNNTSVYISNMTWWTNDEELHDIILNIGVTDIVDIKFYDNRNNGQSKGFAMVVVKSKESSTKLFEAIPKLTVNGNVLQVSPGNRNVLNHLEAQNRKSHQDSSAKESGSVISSNNYESRNNNRSHNGPNSSGNNFNRNNGSNRSNRHNQRYHNTSNTMGGSRNMTSNINQNMSSNLNQNMTSNIGFNNMNNNMGGSMTAGNNMMTNMMGNMGGMMNRLPMMNQNNTIRNNMMPMNTMNNMPNNMMRPGMPQIMNPVTNINNPLANIMANIMPGLQNQLLPGQNIAPHINPAFINSAQLNSVAPNTSNSVLDHSDRREAPIPPSSEIPQCNDSYNHREDSPIERHVSMDEFEEIQTRNKNVCSSAIARAVQDATAGDFANSIETLVTAISLIKRSKICKDNSSKLLITSLQDTLYGIENKSYGNRTVRHEEKRTRRERSRSRSRERSRSRDRSRRRSRERYRDRKYYR